MVDKRITEISKAGKVACVSSVKIENHTVVVDGSLVKIASILGEQWKQRQYIRDPRIFIEGIRRSRLSVDIFTFGQKIPDVIPKYNYYMEWDNCAAIPLTKYEQWWKDRLPQVTRKNVRRAKKRGVEIREVGFDEYLIRGIKKIQDSNPVLQGRRNVHYGKDFDTIKKDYGTHLHCSKFLGAFYNDRMIGFIKIVNVDDLAYLLQLSSDPRHNDKRPMNALIARSVEESIKEDKSYLIYGRYFEWNKRKSSLIEFKKRNGFTPIFYPRYYIPLTNKGKIAIRLKYHLGLIGILPDALISPLLKIRSKMHLAKIKKKNYL